MIVYLSEDGQIEVVMIVRDENLPSAVDAHTNGIVTDAFSSNLSYKLTWKNKDHKAITTVLNLVRANMWNKGVEKRIKIKNECFCNRQ